MSPKPLLAEVLKNALSEVREKAIPVHTFALYHDHESNAVAVCVDTEENSRRSVAAENRFSMKYFMEALAHEDLEEASRWQANPGRSLSLGDFALVNVARTDLPRIRSKKKFYLAMVQSLISVQEQIAALSPEPSQLAFVCSGPDAEVAYVWSLPASA